MSEKKVSIFKYLMSLWYKPKIEKIIKAKNGAIRKIYLILSEGIYHSPNLSEKDKNKARITRNESVRQRINFFDVLLNKTIFLINVLCFVWVKQFSV